MLNLEYHITRDHGHPWDCRPGFDLMEVRGGSEAELSIFIKKATSKYWAIWLQGHDMTTNLPCAVLYKPCGIQHAWQDDYAHPYPGATQLEGR